MAVSPAGPSSNWAKLKPTIVEPPRRRDKGKGKAIDDPEMQNGRHKRRRGPGGVARYVRSRASIETLESSSGPSRIQLQAPSRAKVEVVLNPTHDYSPLVVELREMVAGRNVMNEAQRAPGKYVAVDCEMVGLGHLGSESALARVSLINFHGHVLFDSFVATRETVTDLRTWVSGVKASDLMGAPTFEKVQKQVAEIVEGKILVGHAVANDLKALLLDHPGPMLRDTQKCPALRERAKSKYPSLRKLTELELGVAIQKGSHSSVTDARATMALYRLHKNTWEASLRRSTEVWMAKNRKRRKSEELGHESEEEAPEGVDEGARGKKRKSGEHRPQGKTGVSSGLGKIVRVGQTRVQGKGERRNVGAHGAVPRVTEDRWWESG